MTTLITLEEKIQDFLRTFKTETGEYEYRKKLSQIALKNEKSEKTLKELKAKAAANEKKVAAKRAEVEANKKKSEKESSGKKSDLTGAAVAVGGALLGGLAKTKSAFKFLC